jgi:hypothetical protein
MIFYCEQPQRSLAELLEEISYRTGFTPAQVNALLDCELDTEFLPNYITAVLSNRMN